jgi:NADH-quinone oxidoreductase subunit J
MTTAAFLFYFIAAMTALCALAVVVTDNIVRAAAWLLFTLAGVAGILFLLGAEFVGATQLLVYVGGTLVLVVFGVMLTAQGPFISMKTGAAELALSTLVGLVLFGTLAAAIYSKKEVGNKPEEVRRSHPVTLTKDEAEKSPEPGKEMTPTTTVGMSLLGVREATSPAPLTTSVADPLKPRTNAQPRTPLAYLLPFEIVSVHLLVVLIGAAYLARAKRRKKVTA